MRSRNVWPGSDVTRTRIQSDSTRVPPVTADRSPPDSRMTGADSPVIADSSTDATPSMISPSAGMNSPARTITSSPLRRLLAGTISAGAAFAQPIGHGLGARLAQRVRLRLAAPLGHRLGEVREEHGQPQPERDLQLESQMAAAAHGIAHELDCRQHAADLDDEHDRVAHHRPRVQLADGRAEAARVIVGSQMESVFAFVMASIALRRSGPRASAGARRSGRGSARGRTSGRPR